MLLISWVDCWVLCQGAYLVGHHGKAPSLFTGPCRLDGGVECQQVGLLGDAAYHLQHYADAGAVLLQLMYHPGHMLYFIGHHLNGLQRLLDYLASGQGFPVGLLGGIGGLGGAASHLVDCAAHLVHGRGQVGDLALLGLLADGGLAGDGAHLFGGTADLFDGSPHLLD